MALQLRITVRAAAQIEKVDRWWLQNRPATPELFRDELRAAFGLLAMQPGLGTRVSSVRATGVRRLHLGRVRYDIFYRVMNNELVVLCVWHSSRGRTPSF